MSINFSTYANTGKAEHMRIDELEPGQHLTRVITPEQRWGDITGEFRTMEYVVVKALKTQLVLENCADGSELRLRVENSKYSTYRNGQVSTDRIGDQSYSRTSYMFATEDEPVVAELKVHWDERVAEQKIQREARAAIMQIKDNLKHADLESVDAAIEALTALRKTMTIAK